MIFISMWRVFHNSDSRWIFIIIIIYFFRVFHICIKLMVFHWSLSDSKSPQVSRTRLSILAVLSNAVYPSVNFQDLQFLL